MSRYVKGRHSFKMGYEWRRTFINSFIDPGIAATGLQFAAAISSLARWTAAARPQGDGTRYTYQNDSGAYFLDSWRVSSASP